jgi:hypothetical protein
MSNEQRVRIVGVDVSFADLIVLGIKATCAFLIIAGTIWLAVYAFQVALTA